MSYLKDQRGIALATALLLSLISMIIVITALYFIMQGTRVSGIQKRYQTALEASYGGLDIFGKYVLPNIIVKSFTLQDFKDNTLNAALFPSSAPGPFVSTNACFDQKLLLTSDKWTQCTTTNMLDPKANWDLKITLQSEKPQPDYDVYVKIVDTMPGNSDTTGGGEALIGHGVTDPGILTPVHYPYVYRIEIQAERHRNPDERAQLSVLYAY